MEIYATRPVIRGRILAALGFGASDADAAMILVQINELIREAGVEVTAAAWWSRRRKEWTGTLGVDQRLLNIPSGAGIGDVESVAVWDEGRSVYLALEHRAITIREHSDPADLVGGAVDEATRGLPTRWDYLGTQIEVWREPDQEYQAKILYVGGPEALTDDNATSEVDAELIHRKAMELYYSNKDKETAGIWNGRYRERLRQLKGWAATCETISADPMVRLSGDRGGAPIGSRFDYATALASR